MLCAARRIGVGYVACCFLLLFRPCHGGSNVRSKKRKMTVAAVRRRKIFFWTHQKEHYDTHSAVCRRPTDVSSVFAGVALQKTTLLRVQRTHCQSIRYKLLASHLEKKWT